MNRLVRAELLKARSTRTPWILAAAAVAICAVWAVVSVLTLDGENNAGLSLDQRVQNVFGMAQEGYLFVLILGILGMAGEHRHRTVGWSFLVAPQRDRVMAAKLVAYALIGLVVGVAAAAVTVAVAIPLLAAVDKPVTAPGVSFILLGSVLSTVLYAVLGVSLGALIRSQVAGVAAAVIWFYYAEYMLVWLLPEVGRWVPGGAANALSDSQVSGGELLPIWAGGLLFLGYGLAVALAANAFTVRRDVT